MNSVAPELLRKKKKAKEEVVGTDTVEFQLLYCSYRNKFMHDKNKKKVSVYKEGLAKREKKQNAERKTIRNVWSVNYKGSISR